jgi:hypothetical protein
VATAMERLKEAGSEAAFEVMAEIQKSAESKIDNQIATFKEKWDKLFNQRMAYAIVAIVGVVALAVVTSLYTATKDVNQAVITLQDKILSSQTLIGQSAAQLEASNKAITHATDSLSRAAASALRGLDSARAALRATGVEMKRSTEELQRLRSRLESTGRAKP